MNDRTHKDFSIHTGIKLDVADILRQLDAVNEFPCVLLMYGRAFPIADKEEMWALRTGVEIGWDLMLDKREANE